jgi:hypothetical protein
VLKQKEHSEMRSNEKPRPEGLDIAPVNATNSLTEKRGVGKKQSAPIPCSTHIDTRSSSRCRLAGPIQARSMMRVPMRG